jgi:hypothetical protein
MTSLSLPYDVPRPEAELRSAGLPRGAYHVPHSKRTSVVPSPRTARKRSSGVFVMWDLHRDAMPPLFTGPHTHPPPLQDVPWSLTS